MPTSKTWPGGGTGATPTSYSIPAAGELNWASSSNFLIALADGAQSTVFQKYAVRKATTSPVTVSATTDCVVITELTLAGAVAVSLPAGANKQVFYIADGTGDAASNNITITPAGAETIAGQSSLVLNQNGETVMLIYNAGDTDWKIVARSFSNLFSNPMSAQGDMIVGGVSGVPDVLPHPGAANYILATDSTNTQDWTTTPTFEDLTLTDDLTVSGLSTLGALDAASSTFDDITASDTLSVLSPTNIPLILQHTTDEGAVITRYSSTSPGPILSLRRSTGTTIGTDTAVTSGDALGTHEWRGYDGSAYTLGASIVGTVSGAVSAGIVPAKLDFYTSSTAGSLNLAMTIDNDQTVSLLGNSILGTSSSNTLTVNATSTFASPASFSSTVGATGLATLSGGVDLNSSAINSETGSTALTAGNPSVIYNTANVFIGIVVAQNSSTNRRAASIFTNGISGSNINTLFTNGITITAGSNDIQLTSTNTETVDWTILRLF